MEQHAILSERLEDQLKAVEWAKAEHKKILKEKGESLSKELMEKMTPFILNQHKVEVLEAMEEAKEISKSLNVKRYNSFSEVLEDCDV